EPHPRGRQSRRELSRPQGERALPEPAGHRDGHVQQDRGREGALQRRRAAVRDAPHVVLRAAPRRQRVRLPREAIHRLLEPAQPDGLPGRAAAVMAQPKMYWRTSTWHESYMMISTPATMTSL